MSERRPDYHYKDFKNIRRDLDPLIDKLGKFPSQDEISQSKLYGLLNGIQTYHGGLNAVREKMGFELVAKPRGYYLPFKNVKKELEPLITKLGHFPTKREFGKMEKSGLYSAIQTYHGGLNAVREKMRHRIIKKSNHHYKDFKNIRRDLDPLIDKLRHFPITGDFKEHKLYGLLNGIQTYHGGLNAVREKMGFEFERVPSGYYKDFKNIQRDLDPLIDKLRHFPTANELEKENKSGLCYAIINYYGGLDKVRQLMGFELKRKPRGYYEDFKNVKKEFEPLITKLGHFPTKKDFIKYNAQGLLNGIRKHGGLDNIRVIMGFPQKENYKIKSTQQLSELLNTEPKARFALENVVQFSDPDQLEVTIADVLSVVWDGRVTRDDLLKMLEEPSLKRYLGCIARSKGGLSDLPSMVESANNLLKYDKNGVIKDLIKRRIENWFYDGSLGQKPSYKEISASLDYLKKQKEGLK